MGSLQLAHVAVDLSFIPPFNNQLKLVQILLENGADLSCNMSLYLRSLYLASFRDRRDVLLILINSNGQHTSAALTIGYLACWNGSIDILKHIASQTPSIPALLNQFNGILLITASFRGFVDIVQYLMQNGCESGLEQARSAAESEGHSEIVDIIDIHEVSSRL